jgi:DNA-binding NarL/FixJ family response regulator
MRVVIGEDSALFREGLARLLADAGHEVVAKAPDTDSLVAAVHETTPDVAVIDIRMPPDRTDDGARAARDLRPTTTSASSCSRSTSRPDTLWTSSAAAASDTC